FTIIAGVGVRVGIVVVMLYYAVKFSDSFSEMGSSAAHNAGNWITDKVTGAAGWSARAVRNRSVGWAAYNANEGLKNTRWANSYGGAILRRNTVGLAANSSV